MATKPDRRPVQSSLFPKTTAPDAAGPSAKPGALDERPTRMHQAGFTWGLPPVPEKPARGPGSPPPHAAGPSAKPGALDERPTRMHQAGFTWGLPPVPEKPAKRPGSPPPPLGSTETTAAAVRRPRALLEPSLGLKMPAGPRAPAEALGAFGSLVVQHDMAFWVSRYLQGEVVGVLSRHTLEAKVRDMKGFIEWLLTFAGHASMDKWLPRDTQGYASHLVELGRSAATINRQLASIRKFSSWAQDQPGGLLQRNGSPIRGVRDLSTDEPDCKKLSQEDIQKLFGAADRLTKITQRKNGRPRRDRAVLSLLYYTGMRVTEVTNLQLAQLQGCHLVNVRRKGRGHTKQIYLVKPCREAILAYLKHERLLDELPDEDSKKWFLLWPTGQAMNRHQIGMSLNAIAREANKEATIPIKVHPHRLRHTFGALFREKSESDVETAAALGHTGLSHVRRYVRKSQYEREKAMDTMFEDAVNIIS